MNPESHRTDSGLAERLARRDVVPAGVFRPDADGSKLILLNQDVSRYSVIALTVEQGPDGVPAPTQAPGMSGPV